MIRASFTILLQVAVLTTALGSPLPESNQNMAALLARLADEANFHENEYLNYECAQAMEQELLRSGSTERAIEE